MKKLNIFFLISLIILLISTATNAKMGDDPLLTKVISEFNYAPNQEENTIEWDIDAWVGRDLNKFWIKSSGEYASSESETESANIELVYSRALYTTWDTQFGVRHDFEPKFDGNTRNWLSFGFIGTAPYFVDTDARIFVGEESSAQLLIELEKDTMLTQRWVLTSELDIIVNGRTNQNYQEGSGLSIVEFGLRLGYEGNRKFQPYAGIIVQQSFGRTKDFFRANTGDSDNIKAVIGIHSWF